MDLMIATVERQVPQRSFIRWIRLLQRSLVSPFISLVSSKADGVSSGWDIHDQVYSRELLISNRGNGYRDVLAIIDLSTYRRIPWENNVPFFLVSFLDPDTKAPLCACPRGLLKTTVDRATSKGWEAVAGVEYEVSGIVYPGR
jgi:glutamine synthetase